MWIIIKYKANSLNLLKSEINKKLENSKFYVPKIKLFRNILGAKKITVKEYKILGDYILCHHSSFSKISLLKQISNIKGLKYILNGYINCQSEIEEFILNCKKNEDEKGFIKQPFFGYKLNRNFKFLNGPFYNMIFKIIEVQKNRLKIVLQSKKTTLNKEEYLFTAI
jgi:hypothetical protein